MFPQEQENLHIEEIRKEYQRIDSDWLILHYKISVILVAFALAVECVMSLLVVNTEILTTTLSRYIIKYIVIPSGTNIVILFIELGIIRSPRISQVRKTYVVSLLFTLICFILFTVHSAFISTYYIFAVAMILTTFYASFWLTGFTALSGLVLLVVSEFFIHWDLDKVSILESSQRLVDFLVALFILIGCGIVCMVTIRYEQKKNEAGIHKEFEREMLKRKLQMDELTGVFNRKSLHDAMRDIDSDRTAHSVIFCIADIDNFKYVNDHYGHHVGDLCLIEFAKILVHNSGASAVYRYGGDEFCLLFCDIDMQSAVNACKNVQKTMQSLTFEGHPNLKPTASFGLSAFTQTDNTARLFIHADQALYEAKELRNAVCVYHPKARRTD